MIDNVYRYQQAKNETAEWRWCNKEQKAEMNQLISEMFRRVLELGLIGDIFTDAQHFSQAEKKV